MTQRQLCGEVSKITGLKNDYSYMNKVLAGARKSPRMIEAINLILGIELEP